MSPQEMRAVAAALQEVSEAVRGIEDVMKRVKLDRAVRRAAGPLGDEAVLVASEVAGVDGSGLDAWAESAGHVRTASTLAEAASRMRWRADVAERPDDLADILADRMASGTVVLPKDLLKDLYLVGLAVRRVKDGEKAGEALEALSMGLLVGAADWADRIDRARDSEKEVLVRVERL